MPHEKYDKLAGVVRKVISQVGVSIRGGARGAQLHDSASMQSSSICNIYPCSALVATILCDSDLAGAGAEGFHMPQGDDEQKMSKGYAFVEFNTPEVSNGIGMMAS